MIAQAKNFSRAGLAEKLAAFEMPSQLEFVNSLTTLNLAVAAVLIICGFVYLLQGWKIFKVLVVINAAVLGGILGSQLGAVLKGPNMPLFGGIAGVLLLAVLAWPLMKIGVSLMGAMAGGLVGYVLWGYFFEIAGKQTLTQHAWAGAVIGMITLGLLAFVIFRLVIMIFTSIQGSLMMVSGLCALLMHVGPVKTSLYNALSQNAHLMILLVAVPALIGFAFQYAAIAKKAKKKKKSAESD